MSWNLTEYNLPEEREIVETMVVESGKIKNECSLVFWDGRWWIPDMSMYMYYTPTHWRYK